MNKAPKLRFKEFSGDWESNKLIDICDKADRYSFTGGPFGSDLKSEHYTNEGVQIIQLQNIGDGEFINENKIYTSEEKANELKNCNIYPGEIIIAKMADPVARACIIPDYRDRYLMASDGIRVVVDKAKYNTIFALNYINSNYFRKKAIINSTGATRLRIGLSELKNLTLNTPKLEEQEKIASFFSLIDDKISLQSEKVEALKDYKKGMMQKIFSREFRFKDDEGRDYPDWEEKKLGDIGTFTSGTGFSEKYQGHLNLPIKVFKVSDMNIYGNHKYMVNANNTISYEILKEMKSKSIKKPAIIFAKVGAAIFLERKRIVDTEFLIDNNMMAFIPDNKNDIEFIHSLMSNIHLSRYAQVGALPSYNASDISGIKVKIPCFDEQNKISKTLCDIDKKIEKEQEKLNYLSKYKKGLLQQMFV